MRLVYSLVVLLCFPAASIAAPERATIAGPVGPDGTEVVCDLPLSQQLENTVGTDRSGLCVFTSINMAGNWANVAELRDFQKKMTREKGGGWPEKVVEMMAKYAPGVKYTQYTGSSPAILDLAMKTGRIVSITYGYSERYPQKRIDHMVNLVHLDAKWGCVLDNNFIGDNKLEWMSRAELIRRWQLGGGGWAVVLLDPGPPPIPVNVQKPQQVAYGAWGPQGCDPVGSLGSRRTSLLPPEKTASAPDIDFMGRDFSWKQRPDDPGRYYLYREGRQIGGWDSQAERWREFDSAANRWAAESAPPWLHIHPTGVIRDRVPLGEALWVNGQRVEGASIQDVLGNGSLVDDSAKMRVSVIARPEIQQQVKADFQNHSALATSAATFQVQYFSPGAWQTEPFKLNPMQPCYISIQGAPDKNQRAVEYFAYKTYPGAEVLAAALVEAVRRADPNYDPSKTPDVKPKPLDPPAPAPGPTPDAESNGWLVWAAVALLCFVLLFRGPNDRNE